MALRISAKRVTATFKAGNLSAGVNGFLRRNASQATATATSLPDDIKHDIHNESKNIASRSFTKFANSTSHRTTSTIYMVATYVRPPPMFVRGFGCHLWDAENKRYLDFTAGIAVNALGHCDPEIAKIML
ncbi:hypothetical protein DID88_000901 [Monilinia fructigena]|uniref:Acetylornithine transaminase n=1 Tax=Monilinia fructigena TaxID=38457 RepID=A0A395J0X2_9HELO|nr:hypothetical protein DID88_000901 [Monilinia fructigena]